MTGKDGKDYIINVPLGTSIINEEGKIIEDILADNYRYIICNGGEGGKGNSCFKSAINHAPSLHENGDLGEEIKVTLKLRYIADVGLIGLPNAGKSTLISALTNAKPRIANYEFTTLTPVLGICEFNNQKITFADIPGLIEGASEGRGLGHEFLKHIERCHILLHIVSLSEIDNIDPYKSFKIIENELKLYSSSLIHKEIILVCNKMDCENGEERFNEFKKHFKNKKIFLISAKEKMGIDELKEYVFAKYENIKNLFKSETVEDTSVKIIEIKKRKEYEKDLEIKKIEDGVFEVNSNFIKY
jgi:GTP-binding protein